MRSITGNRKAATRFQVWGQRFPHGWSKSSSAWAEYEFIPTIKPFPRSAIRPPNAYPDPLFLFVPDRGTALASDLIDQTVATESIPVEIDKKSYRLPKALRDSAPYVLRATNQGRRVYDGRIIGMGGDPLPLEARLPSAVRLYVARFFDAQCSNDMCSLQITHRSSGHDYNPSVHLLTNPEGQLLTLAESALVDCIGVSTLAFTLDNALVVTRQTSRNLASSDLLAPSGSGSLDPRDLDRHGSGIGRQASKMLQDILRRGMERELSEETGIRQEEIRQTKVVGFARWLERGAKPEFFGVSKLSVTSQDLKEGRRLTSDENAFIGGTSLFKMDLPKLGSELATGIELLRAPSLPQQIRDEGSLPLLLALRSVALNCVSTTK